MADMRSWAEDWDTGMSQYGADGMARAGKTAAEILQYFFPGTELFLGK